VKSTFKLLLALIILIIGVFLFYWFQLRPANIKQSCRQKVEEIYDRGDEELTITGVNNRYRNCLVKEGLSPENLFVE